MASLVAHTPRPTAVTATINGQAVPVAPGDTVLTAALRAGIPFPNSCRVGGCGTCKCRLVDGDVRELTETGYLLTEDELRHRTILACQSVPRGDVAIEVALAAAEAHETSRGVVTAQERLTHDIVALRARLETPLPYRAGQFAQVALSTLPGVSRSYSFATARRDDGEVTFFVRKVPGGAFSTHVHDADLVGHALVVEGPHGDFWLRPADAPILCVAGGSGLAPILAMLEAAADAGVTRDVTVLFGARQARDLYALDTLEALRARWRGAFRFVPVLSDAGADTGWTGARGLVHTHVPAHLADGARAYLCGPPAMVDAVEGVLRQRGVPGNHVHADRFLTRHEAPGVDARPVAGVFDYLKFFLFHGLGLLSLAGLVIGGSWLTATLVGVVTAYVIGDAIAGDDTSTPRYTRPWILTGQLWLALPLLAAIGFAAVWSVSPGDPLGFGAAVHALTGFDAVAARAATTTGQHVAGFVLTGLMIGLVGTITGHELTHRTWDPVSMLVGRWLLAFSFDTSFAIEHVYGHHRYVSTELDPATAPRGRNVYFHVVASTIKGNRSAWHIEARRLRRKGLPVLSWHNAFLRGHLMSVGLLAAAWAMGGWAGAAFFTACALWGKSLLEIVNYMEHYGMVRDPDTPVQPRHSWNTNKRISSWSMFNLTRHSHHHAQGEVPYQDLRPMPEAPMMVAGYLTTLFLTMIPPLWHHLMTPKVLAWDRDHATARERELAARANARSGLRAFRDASPPPAAAA